MSVSMRSRTHQPDSQVGFSELGYACLDVLWSQVYLFFLNLCNPFWICLDFLSASPSPCSNELHKLVLSCIKVHLFVCLNLLL